MQIFVIGMHRSGTSLVTRLINLMGAYIGPEGIQHDPLEENPKGFWERKDIRALNDRILQAHGCKWHDMENWAEDGPTEDERRTLEDEARRTLFRLEGFRPWVVKEPRLSLTLPYFLPACEAPVVVLAFRDPAEVATSLEARNGMEAADAYALWDAYNRSALEVTASVPRLVVDHATFLSDPVSATHRLYALLRQAGCRRLMMPSDIEIRAFVSEGLKRSQPSTTAAPSAVRDRFAELRAAAGHGLDSAGDHAALRPRLQDLLRSFRQQIADATTTPDSDTAGLSRDERFRLRRRLNELEGENERLIRALLDIQEQAENQGVNELALRSERDELARQTSGMVSKTRQITARLLECEREIKALRRSLSWKMTKPARTFLGAFRGPDKKPSN
jgi:hypothetical protein